MEKPKPPNSGAQELPGCRQGANGPKLGVFSEKYLKSRANALEKIVLRYLNFLDSGQAQTIY